MNNEALWRLLLLLLLGQIVSFLLALQAFTSSLVASLGVNTPIFLSLWSYLTMALVFGCIFLYRRQKMLIPWYWYMAMALADVQGNYLVNKAFQLTSITSVTLLTGWTIVWVIGLTWYFIGTRYTTWQLLGATICVSGLGLLLLSESGVAGGGGSRPLLGDMLVIAGTLSFAISNVVEEFCVKKSDLIEVVSMFGLFGTLITVSEVAIVERSALESVQWSTEIALAFFGYALSMFLFYALVPFLLQLGLFPLFVSQIRMSGATLFNLSLLTSDMWAVLIRIFFYRQQVDWLFYVSFAIVVVGLIIYSKTAKGTETDPSHVDNTLEEQHKLLNEEFLAFQDNTFLAQQR